MMAALRDVLPQDADLMVDQEGGRVARLRPPYWAGHPSAGAIGASAQPDRVAWLTGALIGDWRWWNNDGKLAQSKTCDGTEIASGDQQKVIEVGKLPGSQKIVK